MSDIRDKWQRLFNGDADDDLRRELEAWARDAEGRDLDRVCARVAGTVEPIHPLDVDTVDKPRHYGEVGDEYQCWPRYSEDGGAAMELDIDAALDAIGTAEALGPVLDPTSARAAGGRLVAIKRLLRALRDVRDAYADLLETVEGSEEECEAVREERGR